VAFAFLHRHGIKRPTAFCPDRSEISFRLFHACEFVALLAPAGAFAFAAQQGMTSLVT
jgi:hypothetical protein